jgi:hypothetical protein
LGIRDISAKLGYSKPNNIPKFELGHRCIPMKKLLQFCEVYGISREDMYKALVLDYNAGLENYRKKILKELAYENITLTHDSDCNYYTGC